MSVTINAKSLSDMLDAHMLVKGEGVEVLTRRYARLCAVELANRTNPWSVGSGGGKVGKIIGNKSVRMSIIKVIKDKRGMRDLFEKTKEEVAELGAALQANDKAGIIDGIGDILVTLTMICGILDIDMTKCYQAAYNEIKDRKGFLNKDGVFIKNV